MSDRGAPPQRPASRHYGREGADDDLLSGRGTDSDEPVVEEGVEQAFDEKILSAEEGAAGGPLRQTSLWGDAVHQLVRNPFFVIGFAIFTVLAVMAVVPGLFTNVDPRECDLSRSRQAPSADAWFGYDVQGCDYYANVIYGARVSMTIGVVVVLGALLLGVTLGALAGYFGGWIDSLIARFTDIWYAIPTILGALLVLQLLNNRGLFAVAAVLVVLGWMTPMRLIRSTVISVKESDYVQAARALGGSTRRIILRHILPNAIAPVLVYSTIAVGTIIAAEATLSFIGVGLQRPAISWGLQINAGQGNIRNAAHLVFFPSLFLSLTVLSFILIGDALRDALDPKLR